MFKLVSIVSIVIHALNRNQGRETYFILFQNALKSIKSNKKNKTNF